MILLQFLTDSFSEAFEKLDRISHDRLQVRIASENIEFRRFLGFPPLGKHLSKPILAFIQIVKIDSERSGERGGLWLVTVVRKSAKEPRSELSRFLKIDLNRGIEDLCILNLLEIKTESIFQNRKISIEIKGANARSRCNCNREEIFWMEEEEGRMLLLLLIIGERGPENR